MKLKLGFIGFGKSANRYHLPFINQDKYEIIGYYKPTNRVFEMLYPNVGELERFDTIESLLASEIDLVVVTSPAKYHFEHAKLVIEAKKHVLIEKPACNTTREYQELVELAKTNGVKLQVYQNRRFDSDFVGFKNILTEGYLGKVMEIESNHTHFRDDNINSTGSIYDGFVFGHAVHFIDQIVSVFGKPDQVISDVANQRNYYLGLGDMYRENQAIDDYYDIKLIYQNMRVRVRFSQLIYNHPPRFIINGTKAGYMSYGIDRQEEFLKQNIYPEDVEFNPQLEPAMVIDHTGKFKVSLAKTSYMKYYDLLFDYLVNDANAVVEHEQVMIVLDILNAVVFEKNNI